MSYNIGIGNAVPQFDKDELRAWWDVAHVEREDAPTFPHDEMTGNGNYRYPGYSAWADFCREAGLHDLFLDREGGEALMQQHPGIARLLPEHLASVQFALGARKAVSALPPGFWGSDTFDREKQAWVPSPDTGKYDPILARLMWLEYWMDWALRECEIPAIYNS